MDLCKLGCPLWLFITITSFCFGVGKREIRSMWKKPLTILDRFQPAQKSTVWEASHILTGALLISNIILAAPVRHLSVNRVCLSDQVRWEPYDTYLGLSGVNEDTKNPKVSPLWLEAKIQPKISAFKLLSARLHWNTLWITRNSVSLFVRFHWAL